MQSKRINNENIDVIVLDISRRDKQFRDYEKLSSEEKVDKICNLIKCASIKCYCRKPEVVLIKTRRQ